MYPGVACGRSGEDRREVECKSKITRALFSSVPKDCRHLLSHIKVYVFPDLSSHKSIHRGFVQIILTSHFILGIWHNRE